MTSTVQAPNLSLDEKKVTDGTAPRTESSPGTDISVTVLPFDTDAEPQVQDSFSHQRKRKGGRKPIYANSEERKLRNRQAQASFRERRSKYINQLEETIKLNESSLQILERNYHNAVDERQVLQYENSLLERILLEKGINVQAELGVEAEMPAASVNKPEPSAVEHYTTQGHFLGILPESERWGMASVNSMMRVDVGSQGARDLQNTQQSQLCHNLSLPLTNSTSHIERANLALFESFARLSPTVNYPSLYQTLYGSEDRAHDEEVVLVDEVSDDFMNKSLAPNLAGDPWAGDRKLYHG